MSVPVTRYAQRDGRQYAANPLREELVYFVVNVNDENPVPLGHEYSSRLFWEKMEREGTDEVLDEKHPVDEFWSQVLVTRPDSSGVERYVEMARDDWEGEPYESYCEALFSDWYVDVYVTEADAKEAIRKEQDARRWLAEHPSKKESAPDSRAFYEKYPEYTNKVSFSTPSHYDVASMSKRDWKALDQWHELIGSPKDTDSGCPDDHYACGYDHASLFGDWATYEEGTFRVDFDQLMQFLSDKERVTLARIMPAFEKARSHSFSELCKLADVDRKTARKFQRLGLLPFLSTQEAE